MIHMVATNEGVIHAHQVDVRYVVHEQKELSLRTR